MSIDNLTEEMLSQKSDLLIADQPYQFLPNLAQIYGDTCALILQQLHWITKSHPFFQDERLLTRWEDGFLWVRIEGFMWWDSLEGFLRHLSKSTFERRKKDLLSVGVLMERDQVGRHIKGDNARWYAIAYGVLKQHEAEFYSNRQPMLEKREADRNAVRIESRGSDHWRPGPGEDTSKRISNWEPCCSEDESAKIKGDKVKSQSDSRQESHLKAGVVKSQNDSCMGSQNDSCNGRQYDSRRDAIMPLASSRTEKERKDKEQQQEQAAPVEASLKPVDVVVESSILQFASPTAPADLAAQNEARLNADPVQADIRRGAPPIAATFLAAAPAPDLSGAQFLAAQLSGGGVPAELAARLVREWPELAGLARLDEKGLLKRLGTVGITARKAQALLADPGPDEVRWQLLLWKYRPESKDDYWQGKDDKRTGALINRIESTALPTAPFWAAVNDKVRAWEREERAARLRAERETAEVFLATLTPRQGKALNRDVEAELRADYGAGRAFTPGSPEFLEARNRLLNDAKTREWLAQVEAPPAPRQDSAEADHVVEGEVVDPRALPSPPAEAGPYAPPPHVVQRLMHYCRQLLSRLREAGGLEPLDGLIQALPSLTADERAWLKAEVAAQWEARQKEEAA